MRGIRNIESRLSRGLLLATAGLLAAGASACSGAAGASSTAGASSASSASGQASNVGPVSGTSAATSQHHNPVKNVPTTVDPTRSTVADPITSKAVTPECKAGSLSLSLGQGDAGMSQQYQALRFTNTGSTACVIVGFPGVSYVTGDSGRQVGAAATRDGRIGMQLTLQPGGVASTTVHSVDIGVFDAAVCKPTPVRGYRVYAPDDTAAMFVPLPSGVQGCAGTTPDPQLSVASIVAGSNGQS
ncbi:MAG TPA: DUF4232 domain-containing protein [Mycobacteriales bacterium]|jgi:hypothetical protein|nr:DUF4232 domain-containing protein [Mycobacteriales bacterium]